MRNIFDVAASVLGWLLDPPEKSEIHGPTGSSGEPSMRIAIKSAIWSFIPRMP